MKEIGLVVTVLVIMTVVAPEWMGEMLARVHTSYIQYMIEGFD